LQLSNPFSAKSTRVGVAIEINREGISEDFKLITCQFSKNLA